MHYGNIFGALVKCGSELHDSVCGKEGGALKYGRRGTVGDQNGRKYANKNDFLLHSPR